MLIELNLDITFSRIYYSLGLPDCFDSREYKSQGLSCIPCELCQDYFHE